jgi:predicted GTPase
MVEKVIIMGAAGRDFHNFNVYFRDNPRYQVVCFTATQIPDIAGRTYPAELAGKLYPGGIPIHPEEELRRLIREHQVDMVAFSYSDVPHSYVMHKAALVNAEGADFTLIGASYTMLRSRKPVVSVCAVRTGCGKSQTTRHVARILKQMGKRVVAVRHPMPYGDLVKQAVQRFATYDDLTKHKCTIEEREEYEPLIDMGTVLYAGVDYGRILEEAEKEADVIIWDGGNNDTPFYRPDVQIVIFDPHRPGHEVQYYPGETNMLMADIAVVNKVDSADPKNVEIVRGNIQKHAPGARIVMAESELLVDRAQEMKGKAVVVVEDGPTLTHGGMKYGAGVIAARRFGAGRIVDPRPYVTGTIKETFAKYSHIENIVPAMGYSPQQTKDLEVTLNRVEAELVLFATPIDLPKLIQVNKPTLRVRYEYKDHGQPTLRETMLELLDKRAVAANG